MPLVVVLVLALFVALVRLSVKSADLGRPDLSFGLQTEDSIELSEQDREWREREYIPTLAGLAQTKGGAETWYRLLKKMAAAGEEPCGVACMQLAIEIQRSGRAQVAGALFIEEAQRQTAKGQLEGLFQLEDAKSISLNVRQETRAQLRDIFLPPSVAVVRAAVYELSRRERSPSGKRTAPKHNVWDAIEAFFKDSDGIAARAGSRYADGSMNAALAESLFEDMSAELDFLEAALDSTAERPSLLSLSGSLIQRLGDSAANKPALAEHLTAIVYARVSPKGALREEASYTQLYEGQIETAKK
ncbi:hypothetical protein K2X33_14995 [bacterium]|nr:hypothetical protein [bacterium]